jgi:hypothetical protein
MAGSGTAVLAALAALLLHCCCCKRGGGENGNRGVDGGEWRGARLGQRLEGAAGRCATVHDDWSPAAMRWALAGQGQTWSEHVRAMNRNMKLVKL